MTQPLRILPGPFARAIGAVAAAAAISALLGDGAAARAAKPSGFEPTLPEAAAPPPPADGAIFQASAGFGALHEGTRARRVGDPLTILLIENTTASKTVSSKNGKSGDLGLVPPSTGPFSFLDPSALKASSSSSFKGDGSAGQTSALSSTLSVTVADVRANGTALVRGEKRMLLSQGQEWVRFAGIVRLVDIDQNNTVPSSRVADAQIEYSGKGALQRASRQGWLGRFFNVISPF